MTHTYAQQLGQPGIQIGITDRAGSSVGQFDHDGVILGHPASTAQQMPPLARVLGTPDRALLIENGVRPVPGQARVSHHHGRQ
jgi:hypothetical protein